MNKRKITKKKYRHLVNWYIHYLRKHFKLYRACLKMKYPFVYTSKGKKFFP